MGAAGHCHSSWLVAEVQAQGGLLELWHQELPIQAPVKTPCPHPVQASFLVWKMAVNLSPFSQLPIQQPVWESDHDTHLLKTLYRFPSFLKKIPTPYPSLARPPSSSPATRFLHSSRTSLFSSSELLHSCGLCLESPHPQSVHGSHHAGFSTSITTLRGFPRPRALSKGVPLPSNLSTSSTLLCFLHCT